jgi:hypothetical protein
VQREQNTERFAQQALGHNSKMVHRSASFRVEKFHQILPSTSNERAVTEQYAELWAESAVWAGSRPPTSIAQPNQASAVIRAVANLGRIRGNKNSPQVFCAYGFTDFVELACN